MTEKEMKNRTFPERFCTGFVQILLAAILLFLAVLSASVTCTVYGGSEIVEYGGDWPVFHLLLLAAVLFFLARGKRKNGGMGSKTGGRTACFKKTAVPGEDSRWRRIFLIAAGLFLIWMMIMLIWAGSDSKMSMESAWCFLAGDYRPWDPVGYVYRVPHDPAGYAYTYPSQNGLILYMAAVSFIFGAAAPHFVQIFNIGFLFLGAFFLGQLASELFEGEDRRKMALLLLSCLPFSFYYLFVYGTVPGFGLSGLALFRLHRYIREGRTWDFWIASFSAAAAVLLKSNYLIVLVAMLLYLASESVFRKKIRLMAAAVLMAAVYMGAGRAMNFYLESVTSRPAAEGIPMTAWVEMGLLEGKRGPGWFNNYNVSVFAANGSDSERTREAISQDLKDTIAEMAQDPAGTADFFLRKTESIWAEPTFQSLWIQEIGGGSWLLPGVTDSLLKKGGILNAVYLALSNAIQTLVYAGAFLFLLLNGRKVRWEQLIPGIIFIGGFLFHLAWEAKGQYTVFYFLLLLPYAWAGLGCGASLLSGFHGKQGVKEAD